MSFVDTHSHLYREYYADYLNNAVNNAINAAVTRIILPCVNASSVKDIFEAVNTFPNNLFPLIGLHPSDVKEDYLDQLQKLEKYIDDEGVVGIGETGIDLFHDKTFFNQQKNAFEVQLVWAKEMQLPLSIHVRDAFPEAISIIKKIHYTDFKGVFHCFSGGIQEAKWAINNGFLLGISGVITFKKNKLQDIVKEVGINNIVLETDAPFLAPAPFRGKRNESAYIPYIAEKVAQIFEISVDEVKQRTTENALRIFPKILLLETKS